MSSRRVNVPLYHSFVSAPRNSKAFLEIMRLHMPSVWRPSSCPFHVPCRVVVSDLCIVEHPVARMAAAQRTIISLFFIIVSDRIGCVLSRGERAAQQSG